MPIIGVVNKAIEAFVFQRYGGKLWADLLIDLSLPGYEFEAMLTYEDGITDDLKDRVALALDISEMPLIRVLPLSAENIHVRVAPKWHGFSDVLVGLLRALADDYGALVCMDRLADTD